MDMSIRRVAMLFVVPVSLGTLAIGVAAFGAFGDARVSYGGADNLPLTVATMRRMCRGPLTGRSIPVAQPSFGTVQGRPPLPLKAGEYVLTIDDGPSPAMTRRLLAILREACAPATFMIVGKAADAHPELVRAILAEGHGVGSHSYTHNGVGRMDTGAREADFLHGADAVDRAAWGHPRPADAPRLFRIPGDAGVPLITPPDWVDFLARNRLVLAEYDISPQDWRNDPPQRSFARMFADLPDRGVVVMHDGPVNTAALLLMVLEEFRQRNLKIVALHLKRGDEPRAGPMGWKRPAKPPRV